MSGLFGAIGISGGGIDAAQTWIDATAGNIANANDAVSTSQSAYQEQEPVFTAASTAPGQVGDGVEVSGETLGSAAGVVQSDPSSPLADQDGNVRVANVDLSSQLANLVEAQDAYQANATAMQRAITAYQSALTLGS